MNFRAKTNVVIYSIDVDQDLNTLAMTDNKLFMILKTFRKQAEGSMLTTFDFFRFSQKILNENLAGFDVDASQ